MGLFNKFLKCYKREHEISPVQRVISSTKEQDFIARRVLKTRDVNREGVRKFLLFRYDAHLPIFNGFVNYGDYIQTIATKLALECLFEPAFDFVDRENLFYYRKNRTEDVPVCVMQGWFSHSLNFFPSCDMHPVWIGTHIDPAIYKFILEALVICPQYFREEVGCRDLSTCNFLKGMGVSAYLSRCLTLTMPKRTDEIIGEKVFFVDIPSSVMRLFPRDLRERAVVRNQKWIRVGNENWEKTYSMAENILDEYRSASLVVTSALHCAAPCIAMGIPVLLIALNPKENANRFSALSGIIESKTIDDLKNSTFGYDINPIEIEDLKAAMLKNLSLTIRKSVGYKVSDAELRDIREYIANFRVAKY